MSETYLYGTKNPKQINQQNTLKTLFKIKSIRRLIDGLIVHLC